MQELQKTIFKRKTETNFREVIHKTAVIDREKLKYQVTHESEANLGVVHQRMF